MAKPTRGAATGDPAAWAVAAAEPPPSADRERALFRPSRTSYPGSKFGPKTRYDLPTRRKAYGNADEAEAILFSGTSLQPHLPGPAAAVSLGGGAGDRDAPPGSSRGAPARDSGVLSDAARAVLHPMADRNLPELPLIDAGNDVHGVLVLGGRGAGKTSLVMSLQAVLTDGYPSGASAKERKHCMPAYGQPCVLPECDVRRLSDGSTAPMRLVLTDTPPCGTTQREEQPLCATVSPNSSQHFNAIPSWMRITLRSGNFPHYAVLFVIDATSTPLWEDTPRCRDLARLIAVLKRGQYTVVLAVTKLLKARESAVRNQNYGSEHGGQVGKDPRSSYETFADRYLNKVCAAIQANASENGWSFGQGPDSPPFPLTNVSIFDAPTWCSLLDFKAWLDKRGTAQVPNLKYFQSQLSKLLMAISVRSHRE